MAQSSSRRPSTNAQQTDDHASRSQPSVESAAQDDDLIARAAYERYEARGREDGRDMEDWLTAERQVRGRSTSGPNTSAGDRDAA